MINYYTEYWHSGDEQRNKEVIDCINHNINSGLFDNVYIFSTTEQANINCDIILSERITYQTIFNKAHEGINVLCNADIQFDESIKLCTNIKENEFYALTRYEENKKLHKFDDPYKGYDSQDTWIWKNKAKIKNANFNLGVPGCDNKIAYIAESSGYIVKNPSISIKTYHKHVTNVRNGSSSNLNLRLPPPYKLVPIESI